MIKKLLKSKKGFTLIELIVGLAIFAIISAAVSASLAPTLFAFMRANDFAEYNILLDSIANQILNDLSQSTDPPDFPDAGNWPDGWNDITITKSTSWVRYTIDNAGANRGMLMKETGGGEIPVFPEEFYKRKIVAFKLNLNPISTEPDGPVAYTLTVRLENINGDFLLEREYTARPLILNQYH